jgi:hypothetical protein
MRQYEYSTNFTRFVPFLELTKLQEHFTPEASLAKVADKGARGPPQRPRWPSKAQATLASCWAGHAPRHAWLAGRPCRGGARALAQARERAFQTRYSPENRRCGWLRRRGADGGESEAVKLGGLWGKRRCRRRFEALRLDSFGQQVEDGTAVTMA